MIKYHDRKQHGRKEFISLMLPFHNSPYWEVRVGTHQGTWRSAAYWIAPHDLLSLLSESIQDHMSRNGTTLGGLGPLTSIINRETLTKACPPANLIGAFSQLRFLLPR